MPLTDTLLRPADFGFPEFVGRVLVQVLSIAQAIMACDDTVRFIEHVAAAAPEQERGLNIISFREGRIGKYADITFGPAATE